jgi:hypothetical protein
MTAVAAIAVEGPAPAADGKNSSMVSALRRLQPSGERKYRSFLGDAAKQRVIGPATLAP